MVLPQWRATGSVMQHGARRHIRKLQAGLIISSAILARHHVPQRRSCLPCNSGLPMPRRSAVMPADLICEYVGRYVRGGASCLGMTRPYGHRLYLMLGFNPSPMSAIRAGTVRRKASEACTETADARCTGSRSRLSGSVCARRQSAVMLPQVPLHRDASGSRDAVLTLYRTQSAPGEPAGTTGENRALPVDPSQMGPA